MGDAAAVRPGRSTVGDRPLVSAIVTTFNRRELVREAIDSVLSQTYDRLEVIVVDDGSTDGTPELIRDVYGDRVELLRLDGPSGVSKARNSGVEASEGAFVAWLDDDDLWLPETIEAQMDVMLTAGRETAIVGGACAYIDLDGEEVLEPTFPPDRAGYENFCISIQLPGSTSNQIVRRSAFDRVGGFDESLIRAEDKDLWIRLLRHYEVEYVHEVTCLKRIHSGERVNVDVDVIKRCRRRVDGSIPEFNLRRKARAWSFFWNFRLHWPDEPLWALGYLALSFLVHPTRLDRFTRRIRPVWWHIQRSREGRAAAEK